MNQAVKIFCNTKCVSRPACPACNWPF